MVYQGPVYYKILECKMYIFLSYYVIGLFDSSIISNVFALGVHSVQIYSNLFNQVEISTSLNLVNQVDKP